MMNITTKILLGAALAAGLATSVLAGSDIHVYNDSPKDTYISNGAVTKLPASANQKFYANTDTELDVLNSAQKLACKVNYNDFRGITVVNESTPGLAIACRLTPHGHIEIAPKS